jgi:hypothetical protein
MDGLAPPLGEPLKKKSRSKEMALLDRYAIATTLALSLQNGHLRHGLIRIVAEFFSVTETR